MNINEQIIKNFSEKFNFIDESVVPNKYVFIGGTALMLLSMDADFEEIWIWVNTSDTICENFFEIPAGEYLIVSTSGQTKTVWPLIEAMKLKPCGNLAKKM